MPRILPGHVISFSNAVQNNRGGVTQCYLHNTAGWLSRFRFCNLEG